MKSFHKVENNFLFSVYLHHSLYVLLLFFFVEYYPLIYYSCINYFFIFYLSAVLCIYFIISFFCCCELSAHLAGGSLVGEGGRGGCKQWSPKRLSAPDGLSGMVSPSFTEPACESSVTAASTVSRAHLEASCTFRRLSLNRVLGALAMPFSQSPALFARQTVSNEIFQTNPRPAPGSRPYS